MLEKLYGAIVYFCWVCFGVVFFTFFKSSRSAYVVKGNSAICFALKLQKCFVDFCVYTTTFFYIIFQHHLSDVNN